MDKKQLREQMPRNKNDEERAKHLASLDYAVIKPIAVEMVRCLRFADSKVADTFRDFFIQHAIESVEDVAATLRSTNHSHLRYRLATEVFSEWPRAAIAQIEHPLDQWVTNSSEPETALMSLQLLAMHGLCDKKWLKGWLDFISERMERNLQFAQEIRAEFFE